MQQAFLCEGGGWHTGLNHGGKWEIVNIPELTFNEHVMHCAQLI